MTLAEFAVALASAPNGYAELPQNEVRLATMDDGTIILAHPSSEPEFFHAGVRSQG